MLTDRRTLIHRFNSFRCFSPLANTSGVALYSGSLTCSWCWCTMWYCSAFRSVSFWLSQPQHSSMCWGDKLQREATLHHTAVCRTHRYTHFTLTTLVHVSVTEVTHIWTMKKHYNVVFKCLWAYFFQPRCAEWWAWRNRDVLPTDANISLLFTTEVLIHLILN